MIQQGGSVKETEGKIPQGLHENMGGERDKERQHTAMADSEMLRTFHVL